MWCAAMSSVAEMLARDSTRLLMDHEAMFRRPVTAVALKHCLSRLLQSFVWSALHRLRVRNFMCTYIIVTRQDQSFSRQLAWLSWQQVHGARLAVMMGAHERLGEASLVSAVEPHLLQAILALAFRDKSVVPACSMPFGHDRMPG